MFFKKIVMEISMKKLVSLFIVFGMFSCSLEYIAFPYIGTWEAVDSGLTYRIQLTRDTYNSNVFISDGLGNSILFVQETGHFYADGQSAVMVPKTYGQLNSITGELDTAAVPDKDSQRKLKWEIVDNHLVLTLEDNSQVKFARIESL